MTPSPLRTPATPNPNSPELDSLRFWLNLSDVYTFPHILYFDSAEDLANKIISTDFNAVSAQMRRYTAEHNLVVHARWRSVLRTLFEGRPSGSWPSGGTFDGALRERFGLALPYQEPDCRRRSAPELGQWN